MHFRVPRQASFTRLTSRSSNDTNFDQDDYDSESDDLQGVNVGGGLPVGFPAGLFPFAGGQQFAVPGSSGTRISVRTVGPNAQGPAVMQG